MTPPSPFAGPVPRDAVDPAPLPSSGPATSPPAIDSPSGRGGFSQGRDQLFVERTGFAVYQGYLRDEHKICIYCGDTFYRHVKTAHHLWGKQESCQSRECRTAVERERKDLIRAAEKRKAADKAANGQAVAPPKPTKEERLFAGLRFTDSLVACKREPFLRGSPEPARTMTGSHGQMCAASRVR